MKLSEFKLKTWRAGMSQQGGLDSFSNYGGPTDEPWADYVVLISRSRDSEILDESNFEVALERLGGESKDVVVANFGHWGCGWFELILVNPKSPKIKKAFEIYQALESYPVLDDGDYFDRESESYSDYAESSKKDLAEALSKHFKVKYSPKLVQIAYEAQMEDQYQGGEDSCLNIYTVREPDYREVYELYNALSGIKYSYEKSKLFKTLFERVEKKMTELKTQKAG
jgi:hypothetical protein